MAPLVLSSPVDVRQADWTFRERAPVPFDCLRRDFIQPYAADPRRSVRKVSIDEILIQADGFEDLSTTITLQRRDAHLRHDFQHALLYGFRVVIHRFAMIDGCQKSLPDHVVQSFESQVRINGRCSVTNQQAVMMNLSRIAGFDDYGRLGAHAFADEMMMQPGRCKQTRYRRVILVDLPVR